MIIHDVGFTDSQHHSAMTVSWIRPRPCLIGPFCVDRAILVYGSPASQGSRLSTVPGCNLSVKSGEFWRRFGRDCVQV
jgi:hypothetical protein